MSDPTLIVTVDRTQLGLPDLVMPATRSGDPEMGIVEWTEPTMRPEVDYAPDDRFTHGSRPLGWRWAQAMLNFDTVVVNAPSEAVARDLHAQLVLALAQWRFHIHLDVNGAPRETWICDPGVVAPAGGRTVVNLRHHFQVWECSVPADPVRSTA